MARLTGARLTSNSLLVDLPVGWEGEIAETGLAPAADGSIRRTVAHLANFPLPPGRGDFGSGAVERMRNGDVLVVLFEHDQVGVGKALFRAEGIPTRFEASDFDPSVLQWPSAGMSGVQRFFTHRGRPWCLYVVVGSHIDRADVLDQIESVLTGIEAD